MLRSQISAISAPKGVLKQILRSTFCIIWQRLESRTPIFSPLFDENIFKIIASVPGDEMPPTLTIVTLKKSILKFLFCRGIALCPIPIPMYSRVVLMDSLKPAVLKPKKQGCF
jgi:hypothetical protein